MGMSGSTSTPGTQDGLGLYGRMLDKLLRDTEDGNVVWGPKHVAVQDDRGARADYVVYEAVTPAGTLRLHGMEEQLWELERRGDPVPAATSPARRGEGRLFLLAEHGRAVPFPPTRGRAYQSIIDNLLTVVRHRVEGPQAEEFARRFLGEE